MVNFGPLAAEIGPVVWGTPANFNGLRVLAALLYGSPVVGISQTLRRSTEAGRPSCWALAHILVCYNLDIGLHDPIRPTIIFGRNVTKKVGNQTMLCFPNSPI